MTLTAVGVSHHTAPVEVRERFAFSPDEIDRALGSIHRATDVEEVVVLSTCNRTEIYLYPVLAPETATLLHRFMQKKGGPLPGPVTDFLYERRGSEVVRHLYRVSSGLDSLVTGEAEIQGQVREAYQRALGPPSGGSFTGPVLNRLFQSALSVGGRVRTETTIAEGAASVASVAVELAQKIFGNLEGKRVLVLGAGEASELVVEALSREGVEGVVVANRTYDRAEDLAQRLRGRAVHLGQIQQVLGQTDIVVSSTGAPHALITRRTLDEAFPDGLERPLLFVDIAVPRDIAPEVGNESRVFLYNVDDLRQIVDQNLERRRDVVAEADRIVDEEVAAFLSWFSSLEVVPIIRALRERGETIRVAEVERLLARLGELDAETRDAVEVFSRRLVNKLLHEPTIAVKHGAASGEGDAVRRAFTLLFGRGAGRGPDLASGEEEGRGRPDGSSDHQRQGAH